MAQPNQAPGEDLRFDLQSQSGSEDDAPPASTIYDPSVLALSPELRAKVAAREARNQDAQKGKPVEENNETENSPFHVLSPVASAVKKPFELGVDGKTIRASGVDPEDPRENELELCCFGYIPFYPSVMSANLITFIAGLISLSIGAQQVQRGAGTILRFGSVESLTISGAHILGVASVCVGLFLCLNSCLGIAIAISHWKAPQLQRRWMELLHQSLLILLGLLCLILFCVSATGLSGAGRDDGAYDDVVWGETVQAGPVFACAAEQRLGCAGFAVGQCEFDADETSTAYCPGHFCIDFCKIATVDASRLEICDPCRETEKVGVLELVACKEFEKVTTGRQGCGGPVNEELRRGYVGLLAGSLVAFVGVFVTITVTFYQFCCS